VRAHCKHHAVEQEGQQREHNQNNTGPYAFVVLQRKRPRRTVTAGLLQLPQTVDASFCLQAVALFNAGHVHAGQRGKPYQVHHDNGSHRPHKRLVRRRQRGMQPVWRVVAAARVLPHDMRPQLHQRHFA
jgi:hypothetical protein